MYSITHTINEIVTVVLFLSNIMRALHLHPSSLAFPVGGDTTLCFAHLVSWLRAPVRPPRPTYVVDGLAGGPRGGWEESLYIFYNCNTTVGDGKLADWRIFRGDLVEKWGLIVVSVKIN